MKFSYLRDLGVAGQLSRSYPTALCGKALDDRGRHSVTVARQASESCHEVSYNLETFELTIDSVTVRAGDHAALRARFPGQAILLDATTLDVPELLLLTRAFSSTRHIGYLYVEPEKYRKRLSAGPDSHGFSLSSGYRPFAPIPGFTPELSAQRQGRLLAFVGFESTRLSRVLSPDEVGYVKSWSVAFGVPPFQASWEMHALVQNAEVLNDARQGSENSQDVFFVGANDPLAAYNLIGEVCRSIDPKSERLILAPLGTKPASISVALFAAMNQNVRVTFDFPHRLAERTEGVGKAHHYGVSFG